MLAEVAPGHPLYNRVTDAPNRCGACDEVLVTVGDGSLATVHLKWSGHAETPPYPRSSDTGGFVATEVARDGVRRDPSLTQRRCADRCGHRRSLSLIRCLLISPTAYLAHKDG